MRASKSLSSTAQEQTEVVAGGSEHSVAAITVASFEVIAAHPVLGLEVPNDRLDRGAAAHLAADRRDDAAYLAADPDAELLSVVVAAIAFVDVNATGFHPVQRFQLGDHRPQGMSSKGLPCSALACSTNWPPLGFGPGRHQHLTAELVRRPGFALADAFDLGDVQRIDLAAALPAILEPHRYRQGEQVGEGFLERLIVRDLAPDVADHAASRMRKNLSSR